MPWFFIVTKLLILKILLASIPGLSDAAYEFGYHPSAEEFDNLMRETSKTWTHDLLANERRRSWTTSDLSPSGHFMPKYNSEIAARIHYENTPPHSTWPTGYVEKVKIPQRNDRRHDQQSAGNVFIGGNIGSNFDFQMFNSDETASVAPPFNTGDPIKFATLDPHNIFSNDAGVAIENQHKLHQKPSDNNNIFSSNVLKPQIVAVAADEYDQHKKPTTGGDNIFSNNLYKKPSQFTGGGGSDTIFLNDGHNKKPLQYAGDGNDHIYLNNLHKKPSQFAANSDNIFSNTVQNKPQRPQYASATVTDSDSMFFNNNIMKPSGGSGTTITSDILHINDDPAPIKQTLSSSVIEIAASSSEIHQYNDPASHYNNKNSRPLNLYKKNNTEAHFPIFFTNPTTGIVYAITEVGKIPHDSTASATQQQTNDSIPIYITKEQYDRDMFLVQKHYENACHPFANKDKNGEYSPLSALSVSSNTTVRPQIIRLQNPAYGIKKFPLPKLPTHLHKPSPEVAVNSNNNLPPRRKKKTKKKKKKSNKRRPGHKPPSLVSTTTARTTLVPQIVKGVRGTTDVKPSASTGSKYTSQLERPSLRPTAATTIYSSRPLAATSGYMSPISKVHTSEEDSNNFFNPYPNHRVMKRSVANQLEQPQGLQASQIPVVEPDTRNLLKIFDKNTTIQTTNKLLGKRKMENHTNASRSRQRTRNKSNTIKHRANVTTLNLNVIITPQHSNALSEVNSTTPKSFHNSYKSSGNFPKDGHKKKRKKNRKDSKRDKDNSGFDLFDFGVGDDDDDNDSSNYDYNDSYYDYEEVVEEHSHRPTVSHTKHKVQIAQQDDYTEDSTIIDDLKEDPQPDSDSSAAADVDFGAMEEEEGTTTPFYIPTTTEENISSNTKKNTVSKKRIRRRPPIDTSISYEDYDDYDAANSGVGSFFRMIFYPVQVLMTRIFDGFDEQQQSSKPKYPTYTHYSNSAGVNIESEEDDETTSSLASWFSSWFGFNRRTKKIGSTTAAPPPQSPPPTVASNWFESWFAGGKTTTEASYEDYYNDDDDDDDDKWFFGWFDAKPKRKRRTTTTSTTTTIPQIPILTIVDPLKNPQNWIGILAHHIINSTSSTTHNPLIEAITRATTTENPDIPRKIAYEKYQIWRLKPQDDTQVKALNEYKRSEDGARLQWLKGPSLRGLTDVLVSPKMLVDFQGTLNFETIDHEVLIFDVGKAIAYEKTKEQYNFHSTLRPHHLSSHKKNHAKPTPITMSWHKYHEYDEIISHLESIRQRYPQIIELIHIGRSYEGRPLVIVKIESKEAAAATSAAVQANRKKLKAKKKTADANAVFIEAGTHGLEWIGPATSLWMVSELLRIMKINKTNTDHELIRNTTWYIMPILNPDGYVYTHEYDRFWKKTRSRHISRPNSIITSAMTWLQQKKINEKVCFGVDLDRNWHYQWGKRGSSKSPCNELYAGPQAFSEPETKALSEFLMDYRKQIKLYISMQAYGQILSYPIKANASYNSERIDDFHDVAMVGMDGLRKKGSKSRYKIDATSDLIENRSGCSDAFAAYEVGIPFSYTMHLADNGVHGYLLPSSSIEPTAKDAFEMITAMIDYI